MTTTVTRDIVVEATLPHAAEVVWKALTTAELIGKWLMPNDFEPVVGHKFNFQTKPIGEWNGIVDCEVLEVEVGRRLVYSWKGGSDRNAGPGSVLDSVVTWTLRPTEAGTHVRMVHSGFPSPQADRAYNAMSHGWERIVKEGLNGVAASLT